MFKMDRKEEVPEAAQAQGSPKEIKPEPAQPEVEQQSGVIRRLITQAGKYINLLFTNSY